MTISGVEAAGRPSFRERHHKAIWTALWPVRAWFQRFPIQRGKGLLMRAIILPALPPLPAKFECRLPRGSRIQFLYRENLGTKVLFEGSFESREMEELCRFVIPGTTIIDAGANIGICAIEFARAAGASGKVIAFEPHPDTAARLRHHLALNQVDNVTVEQMAVGDSSGTIVFHECDDPALNSAAIVPKGLVRSFDVPVTTIDEIWDRNGRGAVSVLKIDVEGGELAALRGTTELLRRENPAILLEAWGTDQLGPIESFLAGFGYEGMQLPGFEPHNYLFLPAGRLRG